MEVGTQVVVYGPDGTSYGNGMIAERAGVTNYTMTPPAQPTVQPPTSPTPSTGNQNMAAINTDAQLEQEMANLAGGIGTSIPQVTAVRPTVQAGELQDLTVGASNVCIGT